MYSWEIQNFLESRHYYLTVAEYVNEINVKKCPQIARIKYNPFDATFEVFTNDNYYWKFRLR